MDSILITSISKKVPLIFCVKNSLARANRLYKVIGGDCDPNALGKYFVDDFWHMPLLNDLTVTNLIDVCQSLKVKVIIPTRDAELHYFAMHKAALQSKGIQVMVSDVPTLDITSDKLQFYKHLKKNNFPYIPTTNELEQCPTPGHMVIKERFGYASKKVYINISREEWHSLSDTIKAPIFQPYIIGVEYSADTYTDMKGKCKGVIVRTRDCVVNGESQVTTVVINRKIEDLIRSLAESLNSRGHLMFQFLIDQYDNVHIIECNPRFGGASTLSVAAGLDSFNWFLQEATGYSLDDVQFIQANKSLKLIRYAEDLII